MAQAIGAQSSGISTNFNPQLFIDQMKAKQEQLASPIKAQLDNAQIKFDAWTQGKELLQATQETLKTIGENAIWGKKLATSSNEEIITATANSKAIPGTHLIAVDKLALKNQIGSLAFGAKDDKIAHGTFNFKLEEKDEFVSITIDESNDTYQGMVNAINQTKTNVKAAIINTGSQEKPFQMLLSSEESGKIGKIVLDVKVNKDKEFPQFGTYYDQPSKWQYALKTDLSKNNDFKKISDTIPTVTGNYTGEKELELTFTAVKDGSIGGEDNAQIRWQDNQGRHGVISLDKYNYAPNKLINLVDGIQISFSNGDLVINDTFTVKAKPDESDVWFVSQNNESAKIFPPSAWSKQGEIDTINITGQFNGKEDDDYTLRVIQGGIIGKSESVIIRYESENGEVGELDFGNNYTIGEKLSLGKGLEIALKGGVLENGAEVSFEVEEHIPGVYWWLFEDGESEKGREVSIPLKWSSGMTPDVNKDDLAGRFGKSDSLPKVEGRYIGDENNVYTFTVVGNGTVGTSEPLFLNWEDKNGEKGQLNVGGAYKNEQSIPFSKGLSLQLGSGKIFEGDSFRVRAFSNTVQKAQDAQIRIGAGEKGGGLIINSSNNIFKDAIPNVELNIHDISESPVRVTIENDIGNIKEQILSFIESYNTSLAFIEEALKYDIETGIAGPLQADTSLGAIQQRLRTLIIDPIIGLPDGKNTLSSAGISLSDKSFIDFDEKKFDDLVEKDFEHLANVFRSHGESDNTGIIYLNAGPKTQISGSIGYVIDIQKAATQGSYAKQIIDPITVNEDNKTIIVSINGKNSEEIELEVGTKNLKQFAEELTDKIKQDNSIGQAPFNITIEDNVLRIVSKIYGTRSKVEINSSSPESLSQPLSIFGGEVIIGENVEGTIDGFPMETSGQLLSGPKDSKFEGLRIISTLSTNQLSEKKEGSLTFTRGFAAETYKYLDRILQTKIGDVDSNKNNIKEQLKSLKERIGRIDERTAERTERLKLRYARVESQLSSLKSEQQYLSQTV